jgi:hypothetical protein
MIDAQASKFQEEAAMDSRCESSLHTPSRGEVSWVSVSVRIGSLIARGKSIWLAEATDSSYRHPIQTRS